MDSVEAKLLQDLRYKLASIDGMSEILLQALDKEELPVIDPADLDPVESSKVHAVVLEFVREAIFVLAREIDQLRAGGTDPPDLG